MKQYRTDLHVHIGRSSQNEPVKVTGARDLTFENVARRAVTSAGLEIVGIVDCASPRVIRDVRRLLDCGHMTELDGGGLAYSVPDGAAVTVIPGAELEAELPGGCGAHYLCYLPTMEAMGEFSAEVGRHMTNVDLSTQRVRTAPRDLASLARGLGGLFVPAHVFTPHKGVLGGCVPRLADAMGPGGMDLVDGIELGLSADTPMADTIAELARYTFLSNSDAHSLRGWAGVQRHRRREPSFAERHSPSTPEWAESRGQLRPRPQARQIPPERMRYLSQIQPRPGAARICPACSSPRIVVGVADRLTAIADNPVRIAHLQA